MLILFPGGVGKCMANSKAPQFHVGLTDTYYTVIVIKKKENTFIRKRQKGVCNI